MGLFAALACAACGETRADAQAGSPGVPAEAGASHDSGASHDGGATGKVAAGVPRLFYLDIGGSRVLSAAPDGSDVRVLVPTGSARLPDGIAVDVAHGHVFWTNMGAPNADDGSVQRANLDGSDVTTVVPQGATFTPKQLALDAKNARLYWSDREGMAVMRANLDGSEVETLITLGEGDAARADAANWGVGIALDVEAGQLYWTQKGPDDGGRGSIRRAALEVPAGMDSRTRDDVEILFDALPEPIDLELDLENRQIYWTDRGDNTVSRAPMDPPPGAAPATRDDREILVTGLGEAIGLSLDLEAGEMYYTALDGTLGAAALDGTGAHQLLSGQGSLTGVTYVEVPQ